nr:hypothetical protein CFP56_31824 [Quercus suber]
MSCSIKADDDQILLCVSESTRAIPSARSETRQNPPVHLVPPCSAAQYGEKQLRKVPIQYDGDNRVHVTMETTTVLYSIRIHVLALDFTPEPFLELVFWSPDGANVRPDLLRRIVYLVGWPREIEIRPILPGQHLYVNSPSSNLDLCCFSPFSSLIWNVPGALPSLAFLLLAVLSRPLELSCQSRSSAYSYSFLPS